MKQKRLINGIIGERGILVKDSEPFIRADCNYPICLEYTPNLIVDDVRSDVLEATTSCAFETVAADCVGRGSPIHLR